MNVGEYYTYPNTSLVEVVEVRSDRVGIAFLPQRTSRSYVDPAVLSLPASVVDGMGRTWLFQEGATYRLEDAAAYDITTLKGVYENFGVASVHLAAEVPSRVEGEETVTDPLGVGDVVRFKPTEYEVTAVRTYAGEVDEVDMKPVVEGEGDAWTIGPEMLEVVRSAPKIHDRDVGFWRHREQGYNLTVFEYDGELRASYMDSSGKATQSVNMSRGYLHSHFYML